MDKLDSMCVSVTYKWDTRRGATAILAFDPVPLAPAGALNISFLTAPGLARPPGGIIGRWNEPLRLGSVGEVRDRRPHPGDFYWSWDDVEGEFRRQSALAELGESSESGE